MIHRPMMTLLLTFAIAALALLGGCASIENSGQITRLTPEELARLTPPPNPKVPLADVITLSQAGTPAEALIKKLQETGTFYNLNAQQIVDLSKQGVDQRVIDHLVDAQEKARQATLLTELADRDAKAAQALDLERRRFRSLQNQYNSPPFGFGFYGGNLGPRAGLGWSYGSYYDPFFRTWRPRW